MFNILRDSIMENPFLNNKIIPASKFELYISPFTDLLPVLLKVTPYSSHPTFGFTFQNDDILKRFFVKTIKPKYPASEIFTTLDIPKTI